MKTIKEKMLEANKARTDLLSDNPEINSKWTPDAIGIVAAKKDLEEEDGCYVIDTEDDSEEFMECVYKNELGSDLEKVDDGVAVGLIDFTQDSEYIRLYGNKN